MRGESARRFPTVRIPDYCATACTAFGKALAEPLEEFEATGRAPGVLVYFLYFIRFSYA